MASPFSASKSKSYFLGRTSLHSRAQPPELVDPWLFFFGNWLTHGSKKEGSTYDGRLIPQYENNIKASVCFELCVLYLFYLFTYGLRYYV